MNSKKEHGSVFGVLSIKDLITIASVAVAIALAWGAFSTRLALLEHQLSAFKEESTRYHYEVKELNSKVGALERSNLEIKFKVDSMWKSNKSSFLSADEY